MLGTIVAVAAAAYAVDARRGGYRAPDGAPGEAEMELERVRVLSPERVKRRERITGADAAPDGRWVVVRTLDEARFHRADALGSGAEPLRVDLAPLEEPQGEGIAIAPDGVVLTSEAGGKDRPATLAILRCALP